MARSLSRANAGGYSDDLKLVGEIIARDGENLSVPRRSLVRSVVGQMRPNSAGIFDASGGVWELCLSPYAETKRKMIYDDEGNLERMTLYREPELVCRGGSRWAKANVARLDHRTKLRWQINHSVGTRLIRHCG